MRSRITACLTAFSIALTASNGFAPQARAGLTGNAAAAGALILMLGAAASLGGAPALADGGGRRSAIAALVVGFTGFAAILVGVILLDGSASSSTGFAAVSADEGHAAGLDAEEAQAFNANVSELNAIMQTIGSDLKEQGVPLSPEAINPKFDEYGASLPPKALSAARKISTYAAHQLAERERVR